MYAIALFVVYIPGVVMVQRTMSVHKPLPLDRVLKWWNCLLALLSFSGFGVNLQYLTTPGMEFETSYTSLQYSDGIYGFITMCFVLSKLPEMLDTLFIVLRKKQLTTLHVFHHLTVAIYCWLSIAYPTPIGYWFSLVNMFVHGIMYLYFAVGRWSGKYGWTIPMIITILQITQMAWGLCLIGLYATHPTTEYNTASSIAIGYGVIMYSSYLWMFCVFFANKYHLVVPRRLVWILVGVLLSVSWHQQQSD